MTIPQIKREVTELQRLCLAQSNTRFNDPRYNELDTEIWNRIHNLDKNAVGLVGKHIKFSAADGYAHYIIVKENKQTVGVERLPYGDNWSFSGVYDGKLLRGVAEQAVARQEYFKKMFTKARPIENL